MNRSIKRLLSGMVALSFFASNLALAQNLENPPVGSGNIYLNEALAKPPGRCAFWPVCLHRRTDRLATGAFCKLKRPAGHRGRA